MIYAYDRAESLKRDIARRVLGPGDDTLVVSTQVLAETYSVARKRLSLEHREAAAIVERLARLQVVGTDTRIVMSAIDLAGERQIAHWDALMIRAAQVAGCGRLLTEDMQDGARFDDLVLENPFRDAA